MRLMERLRGRGDEGMGLILVIGTATVVLALVTVSGAIASRSLKSGQTHDQFGAMGAAAETGVDQAIARVQAAYDYNGKDYITPHSAGTERLAAASFAM